MKTRISKHDLIFILIMTICSLCVAYTIVSYEEDEAEYSAEGDNV